MKTVFTIIAALALFLAASAGSMQAGTTGTATVKVTVTVLPYAEVTLYESHLDITLPAGPANYGPVYVGGTVICNCPVSLFARVTKPPGAPGDWEAAAMEGRVGTPGIHHFNLLLRIVVWNIPAGEGGGDWLLKVEGKKADGLGGVVTPPAGEATITVVPE